MIAALSNCWFCSKCYFHPRSPLLDLGMKHQLTNICNKIDEKIDREMFCEALHVKNMTNLCCPGELNDDTIRVCLTNITAVSIANVQFVWMIIRSNYGININPVSCIVNYYDEMNTRSNRHGQYLIFYVNCVTVTQHDSTTFCSQIIIGVTTVQKVGGRICEAWRAEARSPQPHPHQWVSEWVSSFLTAHQHNKAIQCHSSWMLVKKIYN